MKKIAVITGSRSEYGPLKILMDAIEKDDELELLSIVTGMHTLSNYGNTYKIVKSDFPKSVIIPMSLEGDRLLDMVNYLTSGIANLAEYFFKKKPDIVVVAGDRSEALAASLAALYLNIVIAHINGGDVSGGIIDESIRHAITKIAHIHLAHNKLNAERIRKMGEEKDRIYITGALAVESILKQIIKPKKEIFKKYNLNTNKTTFLIVQHPISILKDRGYSQMNELFLAIDELKEQTILIYPNCDAGSRELIKLINNYEKKEYIHVFRNLPNIDYLSLMKAVDVMIGNSSSGYIEAPTFKIPVINIGNRQRGREKSDNILNVEPKKEKILDAINFIFTNKTYQNKVKNCVNKSGGANASQNIIRVLKNVKIDENFLQKQITY